MEEKNEKVVGYKVFNPDWTCRGFQYEVGKTYKMKEGDIQPCERGFHFCKKAINCFNYYDFDSRNKCAVVEASGNIVEEDEKCCTNELTIVRELSWHEMLDLCNTGKNNTGKGNSGSYNSGLFNSGNFNSGNFNSGILNSGSYNSGGWNSGGYNCGGWNSGRYNSGNYNSGNFNSGYYNSGILNSGSYNSGHFNSGNFNSGYFNTDSPKPRMFNKETNINRHVIVFPVFFSEVKITEWIAYVNMSEEEKRLYPEAKTTDGYLRTFSYEDAWKKAFEDAKNRNNWEDEKKKLLNLPNFDYYIFEEITGISKQMINE